MISAPFQDLRQSLPHKLQPYLQEQDIKDTSGHSGAKVFQLGNKAYLKIDQKGKLKEEAILIKWFEQVHLGVNLLEYISTDRDYLLTKAADSQNALAFLNQPKQLCQTFAKALKELHQLKPEHFPVTDRLNRYRAIAEQNYQSGTFYEKALLPYFGISDRKAAHALIKEKGHLLTADTFIHGDACLPNLILKDAQTFSCFIDVGLAGFSDKHIDLYWTIWSLHYNLETDAYIDYFLDCYGRDTVDLEKLQLVAAFEAFG
ncbi:aminoglycoside 3'-phosphotransferase [Streptococcus sp. X16XC17]|uniref:phosphotransferase n=1 Tax=unclassified Streptococcus TaxID=2608887 RepID=UPI00066FE49A|nr:MULTISPECIES: phosphotransferase [unclassified Streptococcus]TCD45954.1 aminoglycoside 3'-phosphotransferase [Streptococcus sp. X16XC17]